MPNSIIDPNIDEKHPPTIPPTPPAANDPAAPSTTIPEDILQHLKTTPSATIGQLCIALNQRWTILRPILSQLSQDGRIQLISAGRFALTQEDPTP